jgi:adenine specific DNA methylase Mod
MENRLSLSKELLSDIGSFYLHLDYNADYMGRFLLNNAFGKENFINEIVWYFSDNFQGNIKGFANNHNVILRYAKTENYIFNKIMVKLDKPVKRDKRIWSKEKQGLISARDENGNLIYEMYYDKKADDVWTIGQSSTTKKANKEYVNFDTQKPEELMRRVIMSSSLDISYILDFFSGSGTTINTAHKLGRKWLGVEMGEHFETVNIPRIKKTIAGVISGISKELEKEDKLKKGGIVKYYELECYEDTLNKAEYSLSSDGIIDLYNSRKLANDKILKKENGITFNEKAIYEDIDIWESISNVSGWKIKQRLDDRCIFDDGNKDIVLKENELHLSEYPFLRDLIWWKA